MSEKSQMPPRHRVFCRIVRRISYQYTRAKKDASAFFTFPSPPPEVKPSLLTNRFLAVARGEKSISFCFFKIAGQGCEEWNFPAQKKKRKIVNIWSCVVLQESKNQ